MNNSPDKSDMSRLPTIVAVDFDGTIVDDKYPDIGQPRLDFIEDLKILKKSGVRLILWTCRSGEYLTAAVNACASFGLEFDAVNRNIEETIELFDNDTRKVYADYYIDDKNLTLDRFHRLKICGVN